MKVSKKKALSQNPWLSIWTHPRKTIREIVSFNPRYMIVALSFICGFPWLLHAAQILGLGQTYSFTSIVIGSLVFGIPYGYVSLSITSLFFLWTGRLIKGRSAYLPIRAAVSWSNVPNAVNVLLWILTLIFFWDQIFVSMESMGSAAMGYFRVVFFIQAVVGIWSLVILFHTIGEVQGFSAWMAFLNAILALIAVTIVYYCVYWLVVNGIMLMRQ